jgi:flagellar operon protein
MMMVDKINLQAIQPTPVDRLKQNPTEPAPSRNPTQESGFEALLKAQLGRPAAVQFSAHAQRRMESRQIDFSNEEVERLEQAVQKAEQKGSRESLILMDDLALVVSIKNKTVITAVDANARKDNVFTNIDSVVLT